ncbi:MAG: DUF11 domain-containing protein [Chloroflexi bacterium]|nr:DUF11 domain-containing protein [Chloroflexota bacterium]
MKPSRKSYKESLVFLLFLPLGIASMFWVGQNAIDNPPTWVVQAEIGTYIDPDLYRTPGAIPPLNADIMTPAPWLESFLTPDQNNLTPTQQETAEVIATPTQLATITEAPTLFLTSTATLSSTNTPFATSTIYYHPPTSTKKPPPPPTATPIPPTATFTPLPLSVDLSISKDDSSTTYTAGNATTYTITVSNNGPDDIVGATVQDTLSSLITSASWSCAPGVGASCTANGTGNISDAVDIPAGINITYTLIANISAFAGGSLNNTATVTLPLTTVDPNLLDNSSKDTNASTGNAVIGPPNLDITSLSSGSSVTYNFETPIIANGDGTPDFVYNEHLRPSGDRIHMDVVIIEISTDGVSWYQVFNWGNGIADANTNVDINIIGGLENDNRTILSADLYGLAGITVDIDPLVPLGSYTWVRISDPGTGVDSGLFFDSIEILTP